MIEKDLAFAEAAVEQLLATRDQVEECVHIRRKMAEMGVAEELSVVIQRKGYLTAEQVEAVKRTLAGVPKLAGFEIIDKVGQGSMGTVFKARQVSMDRTVAVKVLYRKLAENETFVERFIKEARASAKLNHLNIIQGIDAGESDGYYYFAMEFVDGPTVHELLIEKGRMSEWQAVDVILQIASALEHAWQNGFVHRDVKPDNIMIDRTGTAKLCDLGLIMFEDDSASGSQGKPIGTPYYISPEQARGEKNVDARSDIYSLGASFYHMVTGRTPFEGASPAEVIAKHLKESLPPADEVVPELSEGTCAVIGMMMAKDANERYRSPAELIHDVRLLKDGKLPEHALGFHGASSVMPAAKRRVKAPAARSKLVYYIGGASAAVALMVIVAVVLVLAGKGEKPGPGEGPVKIAQDDTPARTDEKPPPKKDEAPSRPRAVDALRERVAKLAPLKKLAALRKARAELDEGEIGALEELIAKAKEEFDAFARNALGTASKAAEGEAGRKHFPAAYSKLEKGFPEKLRLGEWRSAFSKARRKIDGLAASFWRGQSKEGERLAGEGKFEQARGVYMAVAGAGLVSYAPRIEAALAKLEEEEQAWKKRKQAEARRREEERRRRLEQAFEKVLQECARRSYEGEFAAAEELLRGAVRDSSLRELKPRLENELADLRSAMRLLSDAADTVSRMEQVVLPWKGQKVKGKASRVEGETVFVQTREGMELPVKMTDIQPEELLRIVPSGDDECVAAASYLVSRLRLNAAEKLHDRLKPDERARLARRAVIYARAVPEAGAHELFERARTCLAKKAYEDGIELCGLLRSRFAETDFAKKNSIVLEDVYIRVLGRGKVGTEALSAAAFVRPLGMRRVKLRYRFSSADELQDWLVRKGTAKAASALLLDGRGNSVEFRVPFDRVESLSFKAACGEKKPGSIEWSMGAASGVVRPDGKAEFHRGKAEPTSAQTARLVRGQSYRFEIETKNGRLAWSFAGKKVAEFEHPGGPLVLGSSGRGWRLDGVEIVGAYSDSWLKAAMELAAKRRSGELSPGLRAEYFSDPLLRARAAQRRDQELRFQWRDGPPAGGVPADNFSARWTGLFRAPVDGQYLFSLKLDDAGRLFLDKHAVCDSWGGGGDKQVRANLTAGLHRLRAEMREGGGHATFCVDWEVPGRLGRKALGKGDVFTEAR